MSKFELLKSLAHLNESTNEIAQIVDDLEREFQNKQIHGAHWSVGKSYDREMQGGISLRYSLTFRRNTHIGAYHEHEAEIRRCNNMLDSIAEKYKNRKVKVHPFTLDVANRIVDNKEAEGNEPYSEYEQSLGGTVDIA